MANTEQGQVEEIIRTVRVDKPAFKRWLNEHTATLAEEFGQNPDIYIKEEDDCIVITEKPSTTRKASMIEAIKQLGNINVTNTEEE